MGIAYIHTHTHTHTHTRALEKNRQHLPWIMYQLIGTPWGGGGCGRWMWAVAYVCVRICVRVCVRVCARVLGIHHGKGDLYVVYILIVTDIHLHYSSTLMNKGA